MRVKIPSINSLVVVFATTSVFLIFILVSALYECRQVKNSIGHNGAFWCSMSSDGLMNILTLAIVLVGIGTLIATNRSHQRQLRAYIHPVGKVTIEGLDTLNDITKFFPENWEGDVAKKPPSKVGEKKITYRIVFKNFGQTPAHGIMMEGKLFVANFPLALNHRAQLPKLYSRKELETDSKGLQDVLLDGSLGPNGEIGLEVNLPSLTENEILNLTLGRNSAIYFYGRVEYRDAFNADRQTNFMLVHYKDSRQDLYKDTFSTWINGNKAT